MSQVRDAFRRGSIAGRRLALLAGLLAGLLAASPLTGQAAAERITAGDQARDRRDAATALRHYEAAALAEPRNARAHWKIAQVAVDLGEAAQGDRAKALYAQAATAAKTAVELAPQDAEAHFHLARATGRTALSVGVRDRVKYAATVHDHAAEALRLDPRHPGAHHVLGVWNAEVMRLNGMQRFIARKMMGGKVFDKAKWSEAVRHLEEAVALEPERIVHRLSLAEIYRDTGNKGKAREQLERIARMPATDVNDDRYRRTAEEVLRRL